MDKEKIKVVPLETKKQAIEKAIELWIAIANSPDGTNKNDVLDKGYKSDCPLCDYLEYDCFECPLVHCYNAGQPFFNWGNNKTAANARAVLEQLIIAKERLYGKIQD